MISVSEVFFSQLSNNAGSFSEIYYFKLQKLQNILYLKKPIFNILFYHLDRKLSIFYIENDIFQKGCFLREIKRERVFESENGKFQKNCLHHWEAEKKYVGIAY